MFFQCKVGIPPLELELQWDPGISPSCRQRRRSCTGHRPEPRPSAGFVVYTAAAADLYKFLISSFMSAVSF